MGDKKSRMRKWYDFYIDNLWLGIFVPALSSAWLVLLQFFGSQWSFVDERGVWNTPGKIITVLFVFLHIVFSVVKSFADKKNKTTGEREQIMTEQEKQKSIQGQRVYRTLLEELNGASQAKLAYLEKNISKSNEETFDFVQASTSKEHIRELLNRIQSMVSEISDLEKSKIGLSVIILRNSKSWDWLEDINIDDDLSIDELIDNQNTAARHIIDKKAQCIFWPDKRRGIEAQQFIASEYDKEHGSMGSIYCKDISIEETRAILTITTYGGQICDQDDSHKKTIFSRTIMPKFETQLKIEISLLQMAHVI